MASAVRAAAGVAKKIYFAGSIRGGREDAEIYRFVCDAAAVTQQPRVACDVNGLCGCRTDS